MNSLSFSMLNFFNAGDYVSKIVILILLLFSIISWSIILSKFCLIKKLNQKMQKFLSLFWSTKSLEQLYTNSTDEGNPIYFVFKHGMQEHKKVTIHNLSTLEKLEHKNRVLESMHCAKDSIISKISNMVSILGTVGSTAPFIGLFGTVWGIMNSFQAIATAKNATLSVVAPGISEALFATAIGLVVAIPAMAAYNYLIVKIDILQNHIDSFINDFSRMISRNIFTHNKN